MHRCGSLVLLLPGVGVLSSCAGRVALTGLGGSLGVEDAGGTVQVSRGLSEGRGESRGPSCTFAGVLLRCTALCLFTQHWTRPGALSVRRAGGWPRDHTGVSARL